METEASAQKVDEKLYSRQVRRSVVFMSPPGVSAIAARRACPIVPVSWAFVPFCFRRFCVLLLSCQLIA